MNINELERFRRGEEILEKIGVYERKINEWNYEHHRKHTDIDVARLPDETYIKIKEMVLSDLEYHLRKLQIEFENL